MTKKKKGTGLAGRAFQDSEERCRGETCQGEESQSKDGGQKVNRKPSPSRDGCREPQMVTANGEKSNSRSCVPEQGKLGRVVLHRQDRRQAVEAPADGCSRPCRLPEEGNDSTTIDGTLLSYQTPAQGAGRIVPDAPVHSRTEGRITVEKFNVYKEKDEQRPDYGKYKFYAQVGDTKMSAVASRQA